MSKNLCDKFCELTFTFKRLKWLITWVKPLTMSFSYETHRAEPDVMSSHTAAYLDSYCFLKCGTDCFNVNPHVLQLFLIYYILRFAFCPLSIEKSGVPPGLEVSASQVLMTIQCWMITQYILVSSLAWSCACWLMFLEHMDVFTEIDTFGYLSFMCGHSLVIVRSFLSTFCHRLFYARFITNCYVCEQLKQIVLTYTISECTL